MSRGFSGAIHLALHAQVRLKKAAYEAQGRAMRRPKPLATDSVAIYLQKEIDPWVKLTLPIGQFFASDHYYLWFCVQVPPVTAGGE